jgi:hypothetical protein
LVKRIQKNSKKKKFHWNRTGCLTFQKLLENVRKDKHFSNYSSCINSPIFTKLLTEVYWHTSYIATLHLLIFEIVFISLSQALLSRIYILFLFIQFLMKFNNYNPWKIRWGISGWVQRFCWLSRISFLGSNYSIIMQNKKLSKNLVDRRNTETNPTIIQQIKS